MESGQNLADLLALSPIENYGSLLPSIGGEYNIANINNGYLPQDAMDIQGQMAFKPPAAATISSVYGESAAISKLSTRVPSSSMYNYRSQVTIRKPKRIRTAFTTTQLDELEKQYKINTYLDVARRKEMASDLKINERSIKIWFQNRRMKDKRERFVESSSEISSNTESPMDLYTSCGNKGCLPKLPYQSSTSEVTSNMNSSMNLYAPHSNEGYLPNLPYQSSTSEVTSNMNSAMNMYAPHSNESYHLPNTSPLDNGYSCMQNGSNNNYLYHYPMVTSNGEFPQIISPEGLDFCCL